MQLLLLLQRTSGSICFKDMKELSAINIIKSGFAINRRNDCLSRYGYISSSEKYKIMQYVKIIKASQNNYKQHTEPFLSKYVSSIATIFYSESRNCVFLMILFLSYWYILSHYPKILYPSDDKNKLKALYRKTFLLKSNWTRIKIYNQTFV